MDIGGFEVFDAFLEALAVEPTTSVLQDPGVEVALQDETVQTLLETGSVDEAQQKISDLLTDVYDDEETAEKAEEIVNELVASGEVEPTDGKHPLVFL